MNKQSFNPYKYTSLVVAVIAIALIWIKGFSIVYEGIYYILTASLIVYCGWKLMSIVKDDCNSKFGLAVFFVIYTIVAALTLGPIFYLGIPYYANEYLFANVVSVEQDGTKYQHTFIWNSPVEGTSLSRGQEYLYNSTDEPIYLVSVSYIPVKSHYPILGGGVQLKEVIEPKEIIKNNYNVFSYLEIPPDTITEKMRRFELTSSKTYFFIVSEDQYFKLINTP